jgi:hypothetical protein
MLPLPLLRGEGRGEKERSDRVRGVAGISDPGRVSVASDINGQEK